MAKTYDGDKRPLVFGCKGGVPVIINVPSGADETYYENGGRWATADDNQGRVAMASVSSTQIVGWVVSCARPLTASSTEEATLVDLDIAFDTIYEMPIDAAQTPAALLDLLWESCDIVVSTYQYADLDGSSYDVLQIVDFRAYVAASSINNTVITRQNITTTSANIFAERGVA